VIAVDVGKLGVFAALVIFHALLLRFFIEAFIRREMDLFGGELNAEG
jgi:hypothetical protein